MKLDKTKEILILFLAAILLCTACGKEKEETPAAAKATTMSLMKTKGSVSIDDQDGKQIEPIKNLKLYSGYGMFTQKTSYAWINLDRVKLAKMDEKSKVKIQKDEKRLEIHVNSGSLFFHVKEPLEEDETMNIRNSTMAVGIRGTCGWTVRKNDLHSQVYILEGKVTIQAKDGETAKVRAGQKADVTIDQNGKSKIVISKFTVKKIPEFVMKELRRDEDLPAEILDASGLDVLNPLPEEAAEETEAAPEETETAQEEAPESNERARQAYQEILNEYMEASTDTQLNEPGDLFMDPDPFREKYPNAGASVTYYAQNRSFYNAYYDINGDGVEELLIGAEDETNNIVPVALFVYDNAQARLAFGDSGSALSSSSFSIMSDRTIFGTHSGQSDSVNISLWRIGDDGYTLENIFEDTWSYSVDGGDSREFAQERLEDRTEIEINGWQLLFG